ncbi:hypothetical protein [Laspinema olomoucense]|nr:MULTISPECIES: hypothetical protein [unclassified Laspinema]
MTLLQIFLPKSAVGCCNGTIASASVRSSLFALQRDRLDSG